MRKSKSRSAYKKRLWRLVSEYVRRKDADKNGYVKCYTCGIKKHFKELDAGHYLPKTRGLAMMFEIKNIKPQCTYCNRYLHSNHNAFALGLIEEYGQGILKELEWKSHQITKINEFEYKKLIQEYQDKLDKLCKNQ